MQIFDQVLCEKCNKYVDNTINTHNYVKIAGSINKCHVCEWKERHNNLLPVIGYTDEEVDRFLYFFLYKESIYLNDIANVLSRTIDDMIKLFKSLHIANRKCCIKTNCEYCGKEFDLNIAGYIASQFHYCSHNCYEKDKPSKMRKGKESQFYNRLETNCDNCGKKIEIIPSKNKEKNKLGESHHFCCNECYYEFRSKYYVGEKSVNYKRIFTTEVRQHMSESAAKAMNKRPTKNTIIHKNIEKVLNNLGVKNISEYHINFYSIDIYLPDYNKAIEIMGDYWHANPLIYNFEGRRINTIQVKDIIRDKKKRTYLKKYNSINILYLWETDIKQNLELCEALISLFIQRDMYNYNSFNWHLENNLATLNDTIVLSYFEQDKEVYNTLSK